MLGNLYRVPPGAEHTRPLWVRDRGPNTSSAAVTVTSDWTNGQQIPLLLVSAAMITVAGAAQYPINASIRLVDPDSTFSSVLWGEMISLTVAAQTYAHGVYLGDSVIVPPRWKVRAEVVFNAGANSNQVRAHVHGYFISRGSLGLP